MRTPDQGPHPVREMSVARPSQVLLAAQQGQTPSDFSVCGSSRGKSMLHHLGWGGVPVPQGVEVRQGWLT